MGSSTPSMTHASPSSKRSIRGTRSRSVAGTRSTHSPGGSFTWLSAEIKRYRVPIAIAPPAVHHDGPLRSRTALPFESRRRLPALERPAPRDDLVDDRGDRILLAGPSSRYGRRSRPPVSEPKWCMAAFTDRGF